MNNAFVNGFAASVFAPAGAERWLAERPRTAAAMGFVAPASQAAAHHASAAAQATAIRPAIPVHT